MRAKLAAAFAALFLCLPATALDEVQVMRGGGPNSCMASYVKDIFSIGGLTVSADKKQYVFGFMLPGVAKLVPKGKYEGVVAFDSQPPFTMELEGEGGSFQGYLSQSQWFALRTTKTVTLTVEGKTYAFPADRMAEVMDAAANCAGAPTMASIRESRAEIVKVMHGRWIVQPEPKPNKVCHGTRIGLEVDSFATLREDGRFEFGVAEPSWRLEPGKVLPATIDIDQDPPRAVQVLTSRQTASIPADGDLQKRLETAQVIIWHLPWGTFRNEVNGVPELRKQLTDCVNSIKN